MCARCSRSTAAPRLSSPITCCSKVGREKRSAGSYSPSATFTHCSGCRRAYSTRKALRPTCCSFKKPGVETPWTKQVWIYDLRTNKHFTLKTNPLGRSDLNDFVACFKPENRVQRVAAERWRPFSYEEIVARDKASLDIFWLKDQDLEDLESLPEPDVLAEEIAEDLRAALEQFNALAEGLEKKTRRVS